MTTETLIQAQPQKDHVERITFLTLITCMLLFICMQNAYATGTPSPMGDVLCAIVDIVYGNLGRGLSTLAVVIIGVGATLGKTSWGLAMTVAIGIAVIFNAGTIVGYLGSGAAGCP